MNLIPRPPTLTIKQVSEKPTLKDIRAHDHVFILEPKLKKYRSNDRVPLQKTVDHLLQQYKDPAAIVDHPGDLNSPSLTYVQYVEKQSKFEQLTLARKLFACVARRNPGKVIFICNDHRETARLALAEAMTAAAYAYQCRLTSFKKKKSRACRLRYLSLCGVESLNIKRLKAEAHGNNVGRVLAALPPNLLNAKTYINICRDVAKSFGLSFKLFDQSKLQKLGANAFLAVAQGNPHADAGIVCLRHQGEQEQPWLSLVGKGVCFDTGGINLKSADGMQEMHEDMQGSSVALGSFLALRELCPDKTLECWLAITENRVDGQAYTPTEIVTAANGVSIEIVHSDAEGRMALADTLHFVSQNKPTMIIDYATLTGACVYALTNRYNGAFSNRMGLHQAVIAASESSGDRVWPFPLDDDFDQLLQSPYADTKQCAQDGKGDHIAAARFLQRFVDNKIPWLHLDLAASHKKGGYAHVPTDVTGSGVRFTCNLILDQSVHDLITR